MEKESKKIIIIGAGLTGLTLSYLLRKSGIKATVLEANDRIGGRIYTRYHDGLAPVEMGATWLADKHSGLISLLHELKLGIFEQLSETAIYEPSPNSPHQLVTLPSGGEPSYRIKGGSYQLIQCLAQKVGEGQIKSGQMVSSITKVSSGLIIKTQESTFTADIVISTLPPNLLVNTISFSPALPVALENASRKTHTWMGEAIKVALRYKRPFWRDQGMNGAIFSNVGPINEMYDHTDFSNEYFALKGFFNDHQHEYTKGQRKEAIIEQLTRYFGYEATRCLSYEEMTWSDSSFTYWPYEEQVFPHQNNGNPIFMHGNGMPGLFIAGSETSSRFPGYMEGAVRSAMLVSKQVQSLCSQPSLDLKTID